MTNGRKLTAEQVTQIRKEFAEGVWANQLEAAIHYDIGQARISDILTRKTYKDVE